MLSPSSNKQVIIIINSTNLKSKIKSLKFRVAAFHLLLLAVLLSVPCRAKGEESEPLTISISPTPPFITALRTPAGKGYTGFTVEYWAAIARKLNIQYRLQEVSFPEVFEEVRSGVADMGFAAISITADRESRGFDFSHPIFNSGLGILTLKSDQASTLSKLSRFFLSESVLEVILFLLLYVTVTGHVIWLCEKGQDAFHDDYFPGVPEGIWWTIVTMSTVGYGDKVPLKWLGKCCAVLTIFVGIGVFGWALSQLTAFSISEQRGGINSVSELRGKRVAVMSGTTSVQSVRKYDCVVREVPDIEQAYDLLYQGEADAVVYDWPVLSHYVRNKGNGKVILSGNIFDKQYYGFLFPEKSRLREKVNRAHLQLMESGVHRHIFDKYFGGLQY